MATTDCPNSVNILLVSTNEAGVRVADRALVSDFSWKFFLDLLRKQIANLAATLLVFRVRGEV